MARSMNRTQRTYDRTAEDRRVLRRNKAAERNALAAAVGVAR